MIKTHSKTLGGLTCQIVDALPDGKSPDWIVVLCHGFGAPGTDLVPLSGELFSATPEIAGSVQFVFPAAPLEPPAFALFGGRAWWPVDIEKLSASVQSGQLRDLREDIPEELPRAREMMTLLLEELRQESGLDMGRFVLGGFSQGSMIATDVSLRLPESPAALCVWSGTLLCESEWRSLAPNREGLLVLQSHGRTDPVLPFVGAKWLREMLLDSGLQVEMIEFDGEHTIPIESLLRLSTLLKDLVAST